MPSASRLKIISAFASIYLVWGSTYLGIRIAVETLPPFLMAGSRFLIAGSLLYLFLKLALHMASPSKVQWRDGAIIGTFLLLGGNGLVVWAEQEVPSGLAALVISITPLFMVTLDWSLPGGRRPSIGILVGLIVGFIGLWLLVSPGSAPKSASPIPLLRIGALMIACLSWSVGSLWSRRTKNLPDPIMSSAIQMIGGGAALFFVGLLRREWTADSVQVISTRSLWAFAYLIGVGSLVGFPTYAWLLKHTSPARASTYAYVNPIVAVFLGWLLLHEPVSQRTFVAAVIIIAAVAIITMQKNRSPSPASISNPATK